jgi:hypothetical protein
LHTASLSPAQRLVLQKAIQHLGPTGLDWSSNMRREMGVLNKPDWQVSIPLRRVTEAYTGALKDSSTLRKLQQTLATIPMPLREVIPNPEQVLEQKQELDNKLVQVRSLFQ